jgi:c-di-GMP-related signal transduction protein
VLGQPAAVLALRLSLSHEVTGALVDKTGPLGELLSLVAAYEASDLPMLLAAPLPVEDTARAYLDAVAYTGQIIAPRTAAREPEPPV